MIDENPLITVITVVFNGAKHLEQAIRSVVNQSYEKIQYIIIDGGSTDGTIEIIRKYEDQVSTWVSEPDRGIFHAMNKGLAKATGRYIGFLNADDWYEPGIIEAVAEKIKNTSFSSERVIYFNYYWWDEEYSTEVRNPRQCHLKYWRGMTILHQAMFVHRGVYEKLGIYSLGYRFASDYDFFIRMIKAGTSFAKIEHMGVNFRKGGVSTTHMSRSIAEASWVVKKYFGTFSKEYALFVLTNRLPSRLVGLANLLNKMIGKQMTIRLRRAWRWLTGVKQDSASGKSRNIF